MKGLLSQLPEWAKAPLRRARDKAKAAWYFGKARLCPVCGRTSRRFGTFGIVPRKEAQCVHCGALERHRFLWLFLKKKTDLFDGRPKTMLHVAPEKSFQPKFRALLGDAYLTADLFDPTADVKMDITQIKYPDESFDVIYCSHVLEHVSDDRKAMREFYRTLKSDGWAILLVPITAKVTYEDPSIVDPKARLKAFGQEDHVRRYGPDYVDRLREAGFKVRKTEPCELVEQDELTLMGLARASEIYYCTK